MQPVRCHHFRQYRHRHRRCSAGNGADIITISAGSTITLSSSLPEISSTITIDGNNATIDGNHDPDADDGGGYAIFWIIDKDDGTGNLTLNDLTLTKGHSSFAGGGAIYMAGGGLTIKNSTISNNFTSNVGGGILIEGGTATITNSTFTGNRHSGDGGGGAILINAGTLTLTHVTIADNSAPDGKVGGVNVILSGIANIRNSILANNSGADCSGTLNEDSSNLIESGSNGCSSTDPAIDGDSILDTLTGSPAYYPLKFDTAYGSTVNPAIDEADGNHCLQTDQRGVTRSGSATCDIGAYEAVDAATKTPTPSPTLTPTHTLTPSETPIPTNTPVPGTINIDATCSLAQAINSANHDANRKDRTDYGNCEAGDGDDTITIHQGSNITLSDKLTITSTITINGNNSTISGDNTYPIFWISNDGNSVGNLTFKNLTLTKGSNSVGGGAIYMNGTELTIKNSTIRDSETSNVGGGILIEGGTTTITNSTLTGNKSTYVNNGGGAIFINDGTLTLTHVTIADNTATAGETGGLKVILNGTANIRNSILANNSGADCSGTLNEDSSNLIESGSNGCSSTDLPLMAIPYWVP